MPDKKVKQLNLEGKFKSLDGTDMFYNEQGTGNEVKLDDINIFLARALGNLQSKDVARLMSIVRKIHENKLISLEEHDFEWLKSRVDELKLSAIMKEQILDRFKAKPKK